MIAGSGLFPICFADGARRRGVRVVVVAIRGEASRELEQHADEVHWTGVARLGQWIKIFRKTGVNRVVMCGGIDKTAMFKRLTGVSDLPDLRSFKLWYNRLVSREDHTVLGAVADELEAEGIRVESSVLYCPELLAERGVLTRREPSKEQWADIRFGWPIARRIADMQIGQTVVVKNGTVVAVESIDGTDATLRRGGELAGGDAVAVKVAREGHDPRFDIPCVGPETVDVLEEAGVVVLALHTAHTIVLAPDEIRNRADRAKVCIVAVDESDLADEQ